MLRKKGSSLLGMSDSKLSYAGLPLITFSRERDTINCMVISLTSSYLVVGTSSARILIYDIASHQLIHTINTPKDFAVNSVQVMLKPQDLLGHATIGTAKNDANTPIRSVASFQRTRDPKARNVHNILLLLPPNNKVCEGSNQLHCGMCIKLKFSAAPHASRSRSLTRRFS